MVRQLKQRNYWLRGPYSSNLEQIFRLEYLTFLQLELIELSLKLSSTRTFWSFDGPLDVCLFLRLESDNSNAAFFITIELAWQRDLNEFLLLICCYICFRSLITRRNSSLSSFFDSCIGSLPVADIYQEESSDRPMGQFEMHLLNKSLIL